MDISGKWVSSVPWDSDDLLVLYKVEKSGDGFKVSAKDLQDGEEFEITEENWVGKELRFKSFVPSTKRVGWNVFSVLPNGNIESKFSFTVVEELKPYEGIEQVAGGNAAR